MVGVVEHIVIVGASLAGLRAAETLRTAGFPGRITIIGSEIHHPYDRPPLSKKLLAGEWEAERIALRRLDEAEPLQVDWRLGVAATSLDLDRRVVTLADGSDIGFDALLIATGASARRLPGQPDSPNVLTMRTLDDALAMRQLVVGGGHKVVVIGAGFIGLEVAATTRQLGNHVVVLEGLPAPLIRGLGAEIGAVVGEVHADHGVDLRCNVRITSVETDGVTLEGGERIDADVIVVGIGVSPATDWLEGSGLELRDGVVCDATLNTGVPGIYAAGDLARWHNDLFDEEMRVEHWTNAAEQGALAALNLIAEWRGEQPQPYSAVPFFWSDQYDRRLSFLGRSSDHDEVQIVAGSKAARELVALYRRGDRLHGAFGLNSNRPLMAYRTLLRQRVSWDEALAHAEAARVGA